jgi:hypothetical protein
MFMRFWGGGVGHSSAFDAPEPLVNMMDLDDVEAEHDDTLDQQMSLSDVSTPLGSDQESDGTVDVDWTEEDFDSY